jgi:hypothetical protein
MAIPSKKINRAPTPGELFVMAGAQGSAADQTWRVVKLENQKRVHLVNNTTGQAYDLDLSPFMRTFRLVK